MYSAYRHDLEKEAVSIEDWLGYTPDQRDLKIRHIEKTRNA